MKQALAIFFWCFANHLLAQELFITSKWCFEESPVISVDSISGMTPPYLYAFNNSSFTSNSSFSPGFSGSHTATVIDNDNNTVSKVVEIVESGEILASINTTPASCDDQGLLSVTHLSGGISPVTVFINGDQSNTTSQTGTASIILSDNVGCVAEFNKTLDVLCIRPYNGFSPNNDGINDTWVIESLENLENAWVRVSNRFGQIVFESEGTYSPWNGEAKFGGKAKTGSYFYQIHPFGKDDDSYSVTGIISISR